MNKYPVYKASDIEWIDKLPDDWGTTKIKFLANTLGTLFIDGDWIESNVIVEEGIRYITTGNVGIGVFKEQGFGHITEETFESLNCTEVYEGDLLISRLNLPIGRCCLVPNLRKRIVTSVDNVILRPSDLADVGYLKYVFSSNRYFEHTELISRGATMQRISRGMLGNVKIPLPSIQEQIQISKYLEHKTALIDKLVNDKEKLIELLNEELTAIINQSVTKGIEPNIQLKNSGIDWLGQIPEHWQVKKLKYLVNEPLKYGANEPANDDNPENPRYIRITDFGTDGKLRNDTFKSLSWDIAESYMLKDGDILFARSGATVGKTFQFKDYGGKACFAGYLIKAEPKRSLIASDFLYLFTKSGHYENWKDSIFQQATIQNIGADKYNQLKIALPPLEEQYRILKKFDSEKSKIIASVELISTEIDLLKEYKTALISEVVTGKVDVRNEVIPETGTLSLAS